MDYNTVQSALQEKYSTNITDIYIPSLGIELPFKSITVGEQKTLTKLIIEAEGDEYKLYQIILGLIKNNCMSDINISELLEIDRIRIVLELYQSNFFQDDIEIECEKCGMINKIKHDFTKINKIFDSLSLTPSELMVDDIKFTLEYPTVVRMLDYYKTHDDKGEEDDSGFDIYECFIKTIEIEGVDVMNFNTLSNIEISDLLSILPQHMLFGTDGVIPFVDSVLLSELSKFSSEHNCIKCDENISGGVSIHDFFI